MELDSVVGGHQETQEGRPSKSWPEIMGREQISSDAESAISLGEQKFGSEIQEKWRDSGKDTSGRPQIAREIYRR